MILLELSEKELEVLKQGLIKEKYFWEEKEGISSGLRDDKADLCNSLWAKLDVCDRVKPDILISLKDLFHIVSVAKNEYFNLRADLYVSNKRVEENDFKHIALANSLIMWLNGHRLLKQLVKFDLTDTSSQYEQTEE